MDLSKLSPSSPDSVFQELSPEDQAAIRRQTEERVAQCVAAGPSAVDRRLAELDDEWDVERLLEAYTTSSSVLGLSLGASVAKKWFGVPGAMAGYLVQNAVNEWLPPQPVFRHLGFRTAAEIDEERRALKSRRPDARAASRTDDATEATTPGTAPSDEAVGVMAVIQDAAKSALAKDNIMSGIAAVESAVKGMIAARTAKTGIGVMETMAKGLFATMAPRAEAATPEPAPKPAAKDEEFLTPKVDNAAPPAAPSVVSLRAEPVASLDSAPQAAQTPRRRAARAAQGGPSRPATRPATKTRRTTRREPDKSPIASNGTTAKGTKQRSSRRTEKDANGSEAQGVAETDRQPAASKGRTAKSAQPTTAEKKPAPKTKAATTNRVSPKPRSAGGKSGARRKSAG